MSSSADAGGLLAVLMLLLVAANRSQKTKASAAE